MKAEKCWKCGSYGNVVKHTEYLFGVNCRCDDMDVIWGRTEKMAIRKFNRWARRAKRKEERKL